MRRFFSLLLVLLSICTCAAAELPANTDNVCNWYEIFVSSYQDSNGDGIGDIPGLISRLDYIEDMGWNGIWLMPIMPSPSYHKYDVADYMQVDPAYGTLDDFQNLVKACHEKQIKLIIDMPINHTSTEHPWFQAACAAIRSVDTSSDYVSYYNWQENAKGSNWVPLSPTNWSYEEAFSGGHMPDLNLDNPLVRDELTTIFDFWLNDMGVDGFRLDAVTSYYSGNTAANIAMLAWIKETCETLKPGTYLVGECWEGLSRIAEYYQSSIDSFFLFPASQAEGWIAKTVRARKPAEAFVKYYEQAKAAIPDSLLAPFLGNHDTGRAIGSLQARSNPARAKFANTLLSLLGGATFSYYGDEIGMAGSGDDPNKRTAMYWNDTDLTANPPGTTQAEYPYPCVEDELSEPDSLLNYCKALNHLKLRWPQIARGENEFLYQDAFSIMMRRTWQDSSIVILVNLSPSAAQTVPLSSTYVFADELETGTEKAVLNPDQVTIPPYGLIILTEK